MPWVKLDDGLWSHPKINGVSNDALSLYICGLSYAGQYSTDGMLSYANVERLAAFRHTGPSVLEELVESRLWEKVEHGYQIHDYLGYNKSREELERDRLSAAQRQEKHRASYLNGVSNGVTNDPGNAVSNGVSPRAPYPVPVPSPDPVPENSFVSHETNGALPRSPAGAYQDFHDRLRAEKNKPAVLAEAIAAWYGVECKEFARLAKLGGQFGFGELLKTAFNIIPGWNGVDNPLNYIQATAAGRKNGRNGPVVERQSPNAEPYESPQIPDDATPVDQDPMKLEWDRLERESMQKRLARR